MTTYLLLNAVFILAVCVALNRRIVRGSKALAITFIVLLVLTAVFDNVIVGLGIVAYEPAKILGFYVGKAPIEDFMYALLAVVLVPSLWHILEKHHDR